MRAQIRSSLRARFPEVRLRLTSGSARVALAYARFRSRLPIAEKTVLFEAYHGARMSCVPYALFKAMLADEYFREFRFVWTFNPHDDGSNLIHSAYASHPRVEFCRRHSRPYLRHLATAKYLINNKTFHHYFAKRPEQVHVSSWHATAFKTLGKDQYGSMGQYGNVTRNYLQTDYLVMPNRFTADVLLDSCDVRSVFPGMVVDAGYPRSDLTLNADPAQVRAQLLDLLGIDPDKKIVLYAPTWRGEVGAAIDTSDVIADTITALALGLPEGYQLLLKVHDRAYQFVKANPAFKGLVNVPDWMETNELLSAVDVLITDYSSICFDFLCLRRPIIHFVFDRVEYERTRGLYFDMEAEMAGPLCYTADEVNAAIARIDEVAEEYRTHHEELIDRLAYREDGDASRRVLDIVFRGRSLEYAYRVEDRSKIRALVYVGVPGPDNAHVLDALSGLDFDGLDVALLFDGTPSKVDEYYLSKLAPAIKVYYRATTPLRSFIDRSVRTSVRAGRDSKWLSAGSAASWREELLGSIPFDVAVDFSGSVTIWQLMFALTPFARRVVFLPDPYAADTSIAPLDLLAERFDTLACATQAAFDVYSARLAGSPHSGKLVYYPLPLAIDGLTRGIAEDVAHVMGALTHCIDSTAEELDPHCETGDLLFEFRVGGVSAADLSGHRDVAAGVKALASVVAGELSRRASECEAHGEDALNQSFAELFEVDTADASGQGAQDG